MLLPPFFGNVDYGPLMTFFNTPCPLCLQWWFVAPLSPLAIIIAFTTNDFILLNKFYLIINLL